MFFNHLWSMRYLRLQFRQINLYWILRFRFRIALVVTSTFLLSMSNFYVLHIYTCDVHAQIKTLNNFYPVKVKCVLKNYSLYLKNVFHTKTSRNCASFIFEYKINQIIIIQSFLWKIVHTIKITGAQIRPRTSIQMYGNRFGCVNVSGIKYRQAFNKIWSHQRI